LQPEDRLLTGAAHELSTAEAGNRLDQPTLELIPLHLPLHTFQTCLERDGIGWRSEQAGQDERTQAQGRLQKRVSAFNEVSVPAGET
jgi:hypothetical protein